MHIPAAFRRQIGATFGSRGATWLDQLPALIDSYARRWSLDVANPYPGLSYNFVAPATRADGSAAVLKLGVPRAELSSEIAALGLFGDTACAGLLAADPAGGALLIERVEPGAQLATLVPTDDDRTTSVAASLMRQLWRPLPPGHAFPSLASWFAGLRRLRERNQGGTGPLPPALVARAEALLAELLATQPSPLLLHGDLHHFNILAATRQPWLVIDPKGLAGDPAFEPAALLLNPAPGLLALPQPLRTMRRRLDLLAAELGLGRERIRSWAIAFAILSACWSLEDGAGGWEHARTCAELLVQC
jgi:streptomycin 6-kinase